MMKAEEFKDLEPIWDEKGIRVGQLYLVYRWEYGILRECIHHLSGRIRPKRILEAGFGLGYTAQSIIDLMRPIEYIVCEPNKRIAEKAKAWADANRTRCNITVLEDFVQDVDLAPVDFLYDDRYELVHEGPPLFKTKHTWYAPIYLEITKLPPNEYLEQHGFFFEFDNRLWFQQLERKEEKTISGFVL